MILFLVTLLAKILTFGLTVQGICPDASRQKPLGRPHLTIPGSPSFNKRMAFLQIS